MSHLTRTEREEYLALAEELERRKHYNKFDAIFPETGPYRRELYPKHFEFMNSTKNHSICVFWAGNRTGKTECGSCLAAMLLTGKYKNGYTGRKFDRPIKMLVACNTGVTTRDVLQLKLLGDFGDIGSGLIPKDYIVPDSARSKPGIPNAVDMVKVKHHTDGVYDGDSILYFRSYDQDPNSIMGMTLDVILYDEEPPFLYYNQGIKRTIISRPGEMGLNLLTFTSEKGFSEVISNFLDTAGSFQFGENKNVYITNVTMDEVPHLTKEQREEALSSIAPQLREAARTGLPNAGEGGIYPFSRDMITCPPVGIKRYWKRCIGMDVGNHTAAVLGVYDPEQDIWYIIDEYYDKNKSISEHAAAIKAKWPTWVPIVVDPSAGQNAERNIKDGRSFLELYRNEGLNIRYADNTVETGIMLCYEDFASGRLKITDNCTNLLREIALYRREIKDGRSKIIKSNDHAVDAMRYLRISGPYYAMSLYQANEDPKVLSSYLTNRTRNEVTGY